MNATAQRVMEKWYRRAEQRRAAAAGTVAVKKDRPRQGRHPRIIGMGRLHYK